MRHARFETGARYVRANGTLDLTVGVANTNVIAHAGRVLALVESSFPCEVTPRSTRLGRTTSTEGLTTAVHRAPETLPAYR